MMEVPPQSPPVARCSVQATLHQECELYAAAVPAAPAFAYGEGVTASESPCASLIGPAQSLCYAALYGVSV